MVDAMTREEIPRKEASREEVALDKDFLALISSYNNIQDRCDHYATLYENAPAGYIVLDQKGYIKDINAIGAILLGTKKSSLLNMPLSAYIVQPNIKSFLNHLHNCNKTAKTAQV